MRAILLASATATTLKGRRARSRVSQGYFSGFCMARRKTECAPMRRMYGTSMPGPDAVHHIRPGPHPPSLLPVLRNPAYHFKRIGLEAGPLSQWLFSALAEAELPVVCVEARHMQAVLKAQINKTDRNDARGIAQMMRVGLYRPVHVKTLRSQKLRMLLTH